MDIADSTLDQTLSECLTSESSPHGEVMFSDEVKYTHTHTKQSWSANPQRRNILLKFLFFSKLDTAPECRRVLLYHDKTETRRGTDKCGMFKDCSGSYYDSTYPWPEQNNDQKVGAAVTESFHETWTFCHFLAKCFYLHIFKVICLSIRTKHFPLQALVYSISLLLLLIIIFTCGYINFSTLLVYCESSLNIVIFTRCSMFLLNHYKQKIGINYMKACWSFLGKKITFNSEYWNIDVGQKGLAVSLGFNSCF